MNIGHRTLTQLGLQASDLYLYPGSSYLWLPHITSVSLLHLGEEETEAEERGDEPHNRMDGGYEQEVRGSEEKVEKER